MEKYFTIEQIQLLIAKLTALGADFGVKLITAIAVFIIGRWVAKALRNLIEKAMQKTKVDQTLISFTVNLAYIAMIAFVVIAALGQLGIQTTSFIAILGAAGLAVGLALQGSLSNFAAGVLMLIFRPFKVGDYIEGAGVAGTVKEVQIFTTILITVDNKTIIVPNAKITGDNIVNYATQGTRRVDLSFAIAFNEDIDKAKRTLLDLVKADKRVLAEPAPQIAVSEAGGGKVTLICRPWVKAENYWDAYFDIIEAVKKRFDAENINPPVPRQDIHLFQQGK
jgi:small conductance mechanosensitive channel